MTLREKDRSTIEFQPSPLPTNAQGGLVSPSPTPNKGKSNALAILRKTLLNWWLHYQVPVSLWLKARLGFLVLPVSVLLLLPPSPGITISKASWFESLIGVWSHWDGAWYIDIAQSGYQSENLVSFYPVYPHLMRWLGFILGFGQLNSDNLTLAGIIISSVAALVICIVLYDLIKLEAGPGVAQKTVLYLLAFPTSFYLFAVYTEALFLSLAIGAFYAARKNRWLLSAFLVALAILTKNQGLILLPALVVEYAHQYIWKQRRVDHRIFYFEIPGAALLGWLLFNLTIFHDSTWFISSNEKYWYRKINWPWDSFISGFNNFASQWNSLFQTPGAFIHQDSTLYDFIFTALFLVLAVGGIVVCWRGGLRLSYLAYMVGTLVQPMIFTISDTPLLSMPRYLLIIFPAFFLLAKLGQRFKVAHWAYLLVSLPLLVILASRFLLWWWVA